MQLSGIAYEIYDELDQPTDPTTGKIFLWLSYNAGRLNDYIGSYYEYVSGDYSPELGTDEKSILKALYFQNYYINKARTSLTASENQNILSLKDDQSSVSFVNPKEISKVYRDLSKDKESEAYTLANLYKHNRGGPRDPDETYASGHWQ